MNAPYNANEELVAMKHDIADRNYKLKIKEMLITGAMVVGGVALGALALPAIPALAGMGAVTGAMMGGALGLASGGAVASLATMKDREKLKIDESMVDSYMSGKNYWGEGYREEVAERGYSLSGTSAFPGAAPPPPPRGTGRGE